MPDSVRLQAGDLRKLDLDDDTFELIVCFEVIEHCRRTPSTVLDELVRVLAPGGLLLISSPNRGRLPARQPAPPTRVRPQRAWRRSWPARLGNVRARATARLRGLGAAVRCPRTRQGGGAAIPDLAVHKLVGGTPGE